MGYAIHKFFLQVRSLSVCSTNSFSLRVKVLIFVKSDLGVFFFFFDLGCALGIVSKNSLPNQPRRIFSSASFEKFYSLHFTFKPMIVLS